MTDPVRVLLVDDDPLVRAGLSMILSSDPGIAVVGEAADGAVAMDRVLADRPDVVLMDIRMPRVDGLTATARLTATERPPKVLVLTTFDLDDYVFRALEAGASGFLLKDTPPDQLLTAIQVVAQGEALLAPSITRRLIEHFVRLGEPVDDQAALDGLTDRELEVLRAVAEGRSNAEIADLLHMGYGTVKTHVSHLLTKLDARDRAQLVVFAYESGLVARGRR